MARNASFLLKQLQAAFNLWINLMMPFLCRSVYFAVLHYSLRPVSILIYIGELKKGLCKKICLKMEEKRMNGNKTIITFGIQFKIQ